VDIAVVGSETIHRKDFDVDTLIKHMDYVRDRLTDKSVPVCTSDVPSAYLENPKLASASDVVLCTLYPFFSNIPADKAASNLAETYNRVLAAAGGKKVIISESGWPTEGSPEGASKPGMSEAKKIFEATYKWSRENDVEIVFFSEIDEAWKVEGTYKDVGIHWGHFTSVGMLKDAYLPTYKAIAPNPVLDAETVKWAEDAINEMVGLGLLDAKGPSLYEPLVPITRGDFMHFLVKALNLEKKTGRHGATFSDVDPNIYSYFTIGAGQKAGLVSGTGDNLCNPKADIKRQDMFTLIYRALKYAGMDLDANRQALSRFNDESKIAEYAKDPISALAGANLASGDQNGSVNPLANATRAEAAVLLYKVYSFAKGE
jgi:hypothetical protein